MFFETGKNTETGISFIYNGGKEKFLSYRDLYEKALQLLNGMQLRGITPNDEVVFQLEDNKDFIISFWACIMGGITPVPITVGNNDNHRKNY